LGLEHGFQESLITDDINSADFELLSELPALLLLIAASGCVRGSRNNRSRIRKSDGLFRSTPATFTAATTITAGITFIVTTVTFTVVGLPSLE
jgi:hypothetical protein